MRADKRAVFKESLLASLGELFTGTLAAIVGHPVKSVIGAIAAGGCYLLSEPAREAFTEWRMAPLMQVERQTYSYGRALMAAGYRAFFEGDYDVGHQRYAQAVAVFKTLADRGHSDALYELGKLTCLGWGVEKKPELAQEFFHRAKLDHYKMERIKIVPEFNSCYNTQPKAA